MITSTEIEKAYADLAAAIGEHLTAADEAENHSAALQAMRAEALANGRIEGRNAEIREANFRELYHESHGVEDSLNQTVRLTKQRLELARVEVERVRALLRLAELEVELAVARVGSAERYDGGIIS